MWGMREFGELMDLFLICIIVELTRLYAFVKAVLKQFKFSGISLGNYMVIQILKIKT
jgi:hypothetical protein